MSKYNSGRAALSKKARIKRKGEKPIKLLMLEVAQSYYGVADSFSDLWASNKRKSEAQIGSWVNRVAQNDWSITRTLA